VGIRFTGKGRAAQCLEGLDCVLTLLAPPLVDGALGLRLALLRIDEDPALRAAAIRRQHAARALPLLQRRHALRMRLGQNLLGLGQGRWDPGDPLDAGIGKLGTHTMRHSYRSWLDAVGTPIAVQQKLMRHASITTTLNIYGDVVTDEMSQAHSKVVQLALSKQ